MQFYILLCDSMEFVIVLAYFKPTSRSVKELAPNPSGIKVICAFQYFVFTLVFYTDMSKLKNDKIEWAA